MCPNSGRKVTSSGTNYSILALAELKNVAQEKSRSQTEFASGALPHLLQHVREKTYERMPTEGKHVVFPQKVLPVSSNS